MIKNRKKKAPHEPSPDLISEQARTFLAKAIDSGKFCVFIGYEENGQFHFSEHRTPLHIGDLFKMQNLIDGVIAKVSIPARKERKRK